MLRSAAVALILLTPAFALAKTFPIPAEDPVATVAIPDAWEPKEYDGGVEATSADGKVYIAAEMVEADEVKKATEEGIEFLQKQGVELDANSMKTKETKEAGADAFEMSFSGKDKDGPTAVVIELVKTNSPKKFLMLYFWGAPEEAAKNAKELENIGNSLQLTK